MCGIFGMVNTLTEPVNKIELESAIEKMAHRGPDGKGLFVHQNFGLANSRLAIIDLSKAASQPMQKDGYCITYNGAIYNYLELKEVLLGKGYHFKSDSDTEVVLAAYKHWGEQCVAHFNGMWSFCIFDPKKDILFCSRDRFGIKPFYYTKVENSFCFSSEIKGFSAIKGWKARINPDTGYHFIRFGMQDYSRSTLFDGVMHLGAGQNLVYDLKALDYKINTYYDFDIAPVDLSTKESIDIFRHLLDNSVSLRFRSDVAVGSCFSGGLDSSSILASAWSQDLCGPSFKSLSVYYPLKGYDERKYMDALTAKTKIENIQTSPSLAGLFEDLDKTIYVQDEPYPSASIYAQNKLFELANEKKLKVMLDGQGGDEILAGYHIFHYVRLQNLWRACSPGFLPELIYFAKNHLASTMQMHTSYMNFRIKKSKKEIPWLKLRGVKNQSPDIDKARSLSETSIGLFRSQGLQALLHYEDRNSMSHSVESRLPFLDYRLVEFCLGLKDEFKIKHGERKYILRRAMSSHLPEPILRRKDKMGFEAPQDSWMKNNIGRIRKEIDIGLNEYEIFNSRNFPESPSIQLIWRLWLYIRWLRIFDVSC